MRMYSLSINSNDYNVIIKEVTEEEVRAEVNGVEHIVSVNKITNLAAEQTQIIQPIKKAATSLPSSSSPPVTASGGGEGCIVSPIPGHVLEVSVELGEKVLAGQKVFLLEAMKMENIITAEKAGTVKKILVSQGDSVNHDQIMMIIE
jgi:glutaconyl-CoA/methylmalonyl-CoA decarboxylase subunit gamma